MNRCLITGGGSGIVLVRAIQPSKKHSGNIDSQNNNKPEKAQKTIENTPKIQYTHILPMHLNSIKILIYNKIKPRNQTIKAYINAASILIKENFIDLKTSTIQETFKYQYILPFSAHNKTFKLMQQQNSHGCIVNIS